MSSLGLTRPYDGQGAVLIRYPSDSINNINADNLIHHADVPFVLYAAFLSHNVTGILFAMLSTARSYPQWFVLSISGVYTPRSMTSCLGRSKVGEPHLSDGATHIES
jgi:hypothetical protein